MWFKGNPLPGVGDPRSSGLTEGDIQAAMDKIGRVVLRNKKLVDATCAPTQDPLAFELTCIDVYLEIFKVYNDFQTYQRDKNNLAALHALFRIHMRGRDKLGEMWKEGQFLSSTQTEQAAISQWVTGMWQIFLIGNLRVGRGRRFEIRPMLANILLNTDATIPAQELRLPFPFMAIKLPPNLIYLNEQGKDNVDCRYLAVSKQEIRPGDIPEAGDSPIDTLNVMAISEGTDDPAGGLVVLETMPLREGLSVHDEIRELEERRKDQYTRPGLVNVDATERPKSKRLSAMGDVLNLVANVCLYCTNRGADVIPHNMAAINRRKAQLSGHASSRKRAKINRKIQEEKKKAIYIIGQTYEPKHGEILKHVKESGKLEQRHLVRGHWKMQVYGEGRTQRRFTFIEPYWRGPELAEVVARDYVVE